MKSVFFLEIETVTTINSTLIKVNLDDLRKKLPQYEECSDDEIVDYAQTGEISLEELQINIHDGSLGENDALLGQDWSNSTEPSEVYSSEEIGVKGPGLRPFLGSLSAEDKDYIDKNSWNDFFNQKMPKLDL